MRNVVNPIKRDGNKRGPKQTEDPEAGQPQDGALRPGDGGAGDPGIHDS